MARLAAAALGLQVALALCLGCTDDPSSDVVEYCIPLVEESDLTPVARVLLDYRSYSADNRPSTADTLRFLVATEAPITTIHAPSIEVSHSVDGSSLSLLEVNLAVTDALSAEVVSRAAFWEVKALVMPLPTLGPSSGAVQYDGLLGGDLLRKYVVRLIYGDDHACVLPWRATQTPTWPGLWFFYEFPDRDEDLASDGFGVFDYRLAGGGSLFLGDVEHRYGATRVTVPVCVEPAQFNPADYDHLSCQELSRDPSREEVIPVSGVEAHGLVATGTQPLVLSQGFYDRLVAAKAADPAWPASGPGSSTIHLPEGAVPATRLGLTRLALVGDITATESACAELRRRRIIEVALRKSCPWEEVSWLRRRGAAVVELDVTRSATALDLPAYVVDDTTDLFAGLRTEVGTHVASPELLIGAAVLSQFEVIIDYPASRLLLRCLDYQVGGTCAADDRATNCCDLEGELGPCYCAAMPCCQYYRSESREE